MSITTDYGTVEMHIDSDEISTKFDREPFEFAHELSSLGLFGLEELERLASRYNESDYFVASGAPQPSTKFYDVDHGGCKPEAAFERLLSGNQRILLKRPELYDRRFDELLRGLFDRLSREHRCISGKLERLAGSILITSSATITPFHFDPEITMFFQVVGKKIYHVYSPRALTEAELEKFYVRGVLNIAQVELLGREAAFENVYNLAPNKGFHQPRNAPHWVETSDSISISYAFSFETDVTRAIGRTRAFNRYTRVAGLPVSPLGSRPTLDGLKASAMTVAMPVRRGIATAVRRALRSSK